MQQNTLTINGRKTYFCVTGRSKAPKLLLLHGYGGDHRGLLDLAEHIKGFDIIIPDLPGHGFSEKLAKKHTLENYADFLDSFADALDLPTMQIIGHSLGGSIAAMFAGKYPDRVEKLGLISPVVIGNNWVVQAAHVYFATAGLLPEEIGKRMLDNKFIIYVTNSLAMTSHDKKKREEILEQNYENYKRVAAATLLESYMTHFTSPLLKYAENISAPTLIIGGERDFISPPDSIRLIADTVKNHTLVFLPEAGHLAPLEIPEKVSVPIQRFF